MFLEEFDIYGLRGVAQPLQQWEPVLILAEQAVSRAKCWPLPATLGPLAAPLWVLGWGQHLFLGADSVQESVLASPTGSWCFRQGKVQELGWGWSWSKERVWVCDSW